MKSNIERVARLIAIDQGFNPDEASTVTNFPPKFPWLGKGYTVHGSPYWQNYLEVAKRICAEVGAPE